MSFALTTEQIQQRTKTVTRRIGWRFLKAGDLICAVRKARGLKKGEKVDRLAVLRIVDVQVEQLGLLISLPPNLGRSECRREGFPDGALSDPQHFVDWFCQTHRCSSFTQITRIEFEYVQ